VLSKFFTKILSIELLGIFTLIGAVAWFCDGMLLDEKVPFFRDLGTYSYPIKFSVAKSLRAGEIGLWDQHMAAGFPLFAALQPGVFYPPNLLLYFFSFFDAIRWTFLVHFFIAASGAYYLCRHWQYPHYLSLIGALLFAFGGTVVSLSNLLNHFQTAVWLPWIILCGERFIARASYATCIALILVLLSALLAGSPEFYLFELLLLALDGIRLSLGISTKKLVFVCVGLLVVNLAVIAIGMVQLLPTLELLLQSRRDRPIPLSEATYWSLEPISLLGLFLPDKEVDSSLSLGVRLFFAREIPFLLSHYLGILPFLGLLAWGYLSSWKERGALLSIIFISLILTLGKFTPVYGWLFEHIAIFQAVRFPEKFFFITYALLVFAALRGLAALEKAETSRPNFPLIILAVLFFALTGTYVFCRLYPDFLARFMSNVQSEAASATSAATSIAAFIFNLERQLGVIFALMLVYFFSRRHLLTKALQRSVLILIVLFDLSTVHKPLQFLLDTQIVTKSERILASANSENGRLFYYPNGRNLHPSSLTVSGQPSFPKAVALSFENLLPNAGVLYGFDYFQEIDALTRQPYNDFLDFVNLLPEKNRVLLFRALNIRYVITFRPLDISGMQLIDRFPQHFSWLYEVQGSVPRVYIAGKTIYEPSDFKALRLLASPDFDPHNEVLVSDGDTRKTDAKVRGEARITRSSNSRVVIAATLSDPGMLVLTDSFYPGWKVYVNDKEEQIVRANYFFRGVPLSAGNHTVEFKYEPFWFSVGLAVSLLTILFLGGITILIWFRRRSGLYSEKFAAPQTEPHATVQP
jgi:hypothetical protein